MSGQQPLGSGVLAGTGSAYSSLLPPHWSSVGSQDAKKYLYKVYKPNGEFVGTWTDVKDDPQFTQRLNTPGTTMTVQLSRSPNTTKEKRDVMTTQDSEPITSEDGHNLMVSYQTNNSVGEGTDVDINYSVDVYVIYGGFDTLVTQDGEPITTQDGEELLVAYGAPNGVRIFSGFILDYESKYGDATGVTVTLASNGHKLSHELVRSGETIRVTYSNQYVHDIARSVLDTNPGPMTYSAASISSANTDQVTAKFVLNTKLEAIESLHSQTPPGWYWYGNVADNYVYLQPPATQPHHKFLKGHHIKSLELKRSIENLRNRVYFVGAEVSGVNILKKYEDSASQASWGMGLHRITDRRFSLPDSMQRYANKEMSRYSQPIWTTTLTISSAKYDLESIKLGQTVTFGNFGNFIDGLLMQIVSLTYTPTSLTLELGELLPEQAEIVADIEESLQNDQYEKLPDQPS
ncbi:phage tail protein [uncultured Kocuria sp.]|uniref:phage tail protein n=1 Tax=uncultured Kocuria sp. TaxID=259305 RepID=UPI00262A6EC6|nr:phage tail protein [uncultured Kocuria sp.]